MNYRKIHLTGFTDSEWNDFKAHVAARGYKQGQFLGALAKAIYEHFKDQGFYVPPEGHKADQITLVLE